MKSFQYPLFFGFFLFVLGVSQSFGASTDSEALMSRADAGSSSQAEPTIEAMACDFIRCNRKPSPSNPCGGCDGFGVHCTVGAFCPSCGVWCTQIPPLNSGTDRNDTQSLPEIPQYAVISHDPEPRSCDGHEMSGPLTTATWSPTSVLEKISPYGLTMDEALYEQLAGMDPNAAFVVAQRLIRDGMVMATPDMHQGEIKPGVRFTDVQVLSSISRGGSEIESAFEPLREGQELLIRYRTNFSGSTASLIVESWLEESGVPDFVDFARTVVEMEPEARQQLPVIASDSFLAPVYQVSGFTVDR